jgi:DNA-binding transcriptional ArsR family regulator
MDAHKKQVFQLQALVCKTLSDPNRLLIIHELRQGEKSVGELVTALELGQANVSRSLGILRERGIVFSRREGNNVYYSLASPKIGEACDLVRGFLENYMERNQRILDSFNEKEE